MMEKKEHSSHTSVPKNNGCTFSTEFSSSDAETSKGKVLSYVLAKSSGGAAAAKTRIMKELKPGTVFVEWAYRQTENNAVE